MVTALLATWRNVHILEEPQTMDTYVGCYLLKQLQPFCFCEMKRRLITSFFGVDTSSSENAVTGIPYSDSWKNLKMEQGWGVGCAEKQLKIHHSPLIKDVRIKRHCQQQIPGIDSTRYNITVRPALNPSYRMH